MSGCGHTPPGSVLIRTGGVYALQVYGLLSPEIRRCIGGFIDVNLNCLGAEMGLPVYAALADAPATTQAVLLAGRRTLIERLREEAAACEGQAEILDPYRFLEEHGIICRHGVGEFEAEAEDYDVGFPFDEVVAY